MKQALYEAMAQSVIDGEVDDAAQLARQALEKGIDPLDAINNGFVKGLAFDHQGNGPGSGHLLTAGDRHVVVHGGAHDIRK